MKKAIGIFLLACILVTSFSCKKKGCMNPQAENFISEAKKENGTCTFKGSLVIWFNSAKAIDYSATASNTLKYYLNDEYIGTLEILDFVNTPPTCGGAHAVTVERDLGSSESVSQILTVKNNSNQLIDTYTVSIKGGSCTPYLLK